MEWLNQNQGAIIAVLTLVLVLVNILYCIFLSTQNRQSKKQLELLREQWETSRTPIIKFDCFVSNTDVIHIEIENLSLIPIYSLMLECDPQLISTITNKETLNILKDYEKGIYLSPNGNRGIILRTSPHRLGNTSEVKFTLKYKWYMDKNEKNSKQEFIVNPHNLPVKSN